MKRVKGSMTIEASYIIPIVLLVFVIIIYTTFYFHDKNIMQGCMYEVAAVISQKERIEKKEDLRGEYFDKCLGNKLILFSKPIFSSAGKDANIQLRVQAQKGEMKISLSGTTIVIEPENHIRRIRNMEKLIQE